MRDKKRNRRKIKFLRQDAHKTKNLKQKWIKARGMHNKVRLRKKGHRRGPRIGYGSPIELKFLVNNLRTVVVHNVEELKNIKDEGIIIGSSVGLKNKINILKIAKEKNLKILNVKNVDEFLKKIEEIQKEKKEKKLSKKEKKEKAKKEYEEKGKEEKKETKEEKEEREKLEKRKVLESKKQ